MVYSVDVLFHIIDDDRWRRSKRELDRLGLDAGHLAILMRDSRDADGDVALVMAAWLAFLKSRLLLPPEPGDDDDDGHRGAAETPLL